MRPHKERSRVRLLSTGIIWLVVFSGCELPRDPEGTLERVRDGTLRVGVAGNLLPASRQGRSEPVGLEVELLRRIAISLDADVAWVVNSESELLASLESFELDIVIGEIREDTPWRDRVALTQPYDADVAPTDGASAAHVLALPPGENGWLLYVDRWLQQHSTEITSSLRGVPS